MLLIFFMHTSANQNLIKRYCKRSLPQYICVECSQEQKCCPKAHKSRTIRMNWKLTSMHQVLLTNPGSICEALLRMNRSIQDEGTLGILNRFVTNTDNAIEVRVVS